MWKPVTERVIPEHLRDIWTRVGEEFQEVWRNREYEVFVRYLDRDARRKGALHLSIKRLDREPVTDWRHKQSIKNEIAGPEREAVELFPAESRLVDAANQTHLWVGPEGAALDMGYHARAAFDDGDGGAAEMARQHGFDPATIAHGKQRPYQEGLSTGPHYDWSHHDHHPATPAR